MNIEKPKTSELKDAQYTDKHAHVWLTLLISSFAGNRIRRIIMDNVVGVTDKQRSPTRINLLNTPIEYSTGNISFLLWRVLLIISQIKMFAR